MTAMEHRWICTGTCGATLTEEQYQASKRICSEPVCTHNGKPFVRAEVCAGCGEVLMPGERHEHPGTVA